MECGISPVCGSDIGTFCALRGVNMSLLCQRWNMSVDQSRMPHELKAGSYGAMAAEAACRLLTRHRPPTETAGNLH